jgi:hypothetical protein
MSPPPHIVTLRDRSTPFIADEVEYQRGWLRAVGCWRRTRWELADDSDIARPVIRHGERIDVTWPESRIAEVRNG